MSESFASIFNKILKKLPSKSAAEMANAIGKFFELVLNGLSILEERISDVEKRVQQIETQINSLKQSISTQARPSQPTLTQYPQPTPQPTPQPPPQQPLRPVTSPPPTSSTPPSSTPPPSVPQTPPRRPVQPPQTSIPPSTPKPSPPPSQPRPVTRQDIHRQALQELKELFAKVRKREE
ncbi:MAG: hypothetical protein J7J30_02935 [Candidatus Odinarchaeota archaeon]|nr:hypothetical protein [Candidatus Odinarchaeota archaeon]